MKTIPLKAASASYSIHVGSGLLRELAPRLRRLTRGRTLRPFVISSPRIWKLWSARFLASFDQAPTVLLVPAGEKHKRLATIERLAEQLARAGADRDALLIAFGGGVVGDMTGFLASIYMRGVACVQVPTTLLAQVDSAIGGKTGVNLLAGKNLLGAFAQPLAVFADTEVLATLPPRELRAGLQESVKAGIIADVRLFTYLEQNKQEVLGGNPQALLRVVAASVAVKAGVVSQDERESGPRMTLNFGHTLGHALEAATGYTGLLHGEAVGWGSIAALHAGLARATISPEQFARMASLILAYGPLPGVTVSARRLVQLTAADKKRRSGRRAFVLPVGLGATEIVYDMDDAELLRAAQSMLADMRDSAGAPA